MKRSAYACCVVAALLTACRYQKLLQQDQFAPRLAVQWNVEPGSRGPRSGPPVHCGILHTSR